MTEPTKPLETTSPAASEDAALPSVSGRLTIDGSRLKELIKASYLWLRRQEEVVNAYNVYPVPDGDTGTNMMHTLRSAWEAIATSDDDHVGRVAKAVANGALRGSRGNSGIILSQLLRGFARSIEHKDIADAQDLAAAFREAARTAYQGVATPVEGTILTVARETADAVEHYAGHAHDLRGLLARARDASYDSTQRTPQHLKILRDAGVIDSGGYGYFTMLDGMQRMLNGEDVGSADAAPSGARVSGAPMGAGAALSQEGGWGYDVQYLIYAPHGKELDVAAIRAKIESLGDCPLVLGDEQIVKVHVHVPDPGVPISYGASLGSLRDVVVEDMQAQSEAFLPGEGATPAGAKPAAPQEEIEIGIVAVASGDGMIEVFQALGVHAVIQGGQTMNPSVDDFLNAIDALHARSVVLLPNNGNIVMTAQQAASLSKIPTRVVATKTLPQGIAAAIGFNFTADLESNVSAMTAAAGRITTGEITTSTRTVNINGVAVRNGQTIGLINDKLAVAGDSVADATMALLTAARAGESELITLYYGNGMSESDAEGIADAVRSAYPDQSIEVAFGGQPHYFFVIGIE
jgi:DAK2 domain fusion protein YloV